MASGWDGRENRVDPFNFCGGGGGEGEGFGLGKKEFSQEAYEFYSYKVRGRAKVGEDDSISGEPNFPANVLG